MSIWRPGRKDYLVCSHQLYEYLNDFFSCFLGPNSTGFSASCFLLLCMYRRNHISRTSRKRSAPLLLVDRTGPNLFICGFGSRGDDTEEPEMTLKNRLPAHTFIRRVRAQPSWRQHFDSWLFLLSGKLWNGPVSYLRYASIDCVSCKLVVCSMDCSL